MDVLNFGKFQNSGQQIINPIFKAGSDDSTNPMNYSGITLVSVPTKICAKFSFGCVIRSKQYSVR